VLCLISRAHNIVSNAVLPCQNALHCNVVQWPSSPIGINLLQLYKAYNELFKVCIMCALVGLLVLSVRIRLPYIFSVTMKHVEVASHVTEGIMASLHHFSFNPRYTSVDKTCYNNFWCQYCTPGAYKRPCAHPCDKKTRTIDTSLKSICLHLPSI